MASYQLWYVIIGSSYICGVLFTWLHGWNLLSDLDGFLSFICFHTESIPPPSPYVSLVPFLHSFCNFGCLKPCPACHISKFGVSLSLLLLLLNFLYNQAPDPLHPKMKNWISWKFGDIETWIWFFLPLFIPMLFEFTA